MQVTGKDTRMMPKTTSNTSFVLTGLLLLVNNNNQLQAGRLIQE